MSNIIKKIFKKKTTEREENFMYSNKEGYGGIMYQNDHTRLVHDSCSICYNKLRDRTYDERVAYISDKIRVGHESITEHSNVITKFTLTKELYPELAELLTTARYLNSKIVEKDNKVHVLLGGSIRGYKHIIRTIENPNNKVYSILKESLYELPYCYFTDMIKDGIFEKRLFNIVDNQLEVTMKGEEVVTQKRFNGKIIRKDKFDIVGMDNIAKILELVNNHEEIFTINDILDMVTITVLFKGVSRTASHQLVRHRAGITQLSQRYVNMKDANFLSPEEFKPEKYNKDDIYEIKLFAEVDGKETIVRIPLKLKEIGNMEISIYNQLIEQGLLKEDARSFLPSNVETSLYMTFTFRNFIKFLELRTGKGAQAEIKELANELEKIFIEEQSKNLGEDIYQYLLPAYTRIQMELESMGEDQIDEVVGEIEEITIPMEDKNV